MFVESIHYLTKLMKKMCVQKAATFEEKEHNVVSLVSLKLMCVTE